MYNKGNVNKVPKILNDNPKNVTSIKSSNVNHPILIDRKEDKNPVLVKTFRYKKSTR